MRSKAAEIMEVGTCIVRDNTTLADVATVLAHKGGQVVMISTEEGALKGIYTETDLARAFIKGIDPGTPMDQIMTKEPVYVGPEDSLEHCSEMMAQHGFRHLPVYDGKRILGLVGILSIQAEVNKRLEQSLARLKRRDEYLSVVAHDMRSPITIVHSCSEMLKMAMENKDYTQAEIDELLDRITENSEAALHLMSNLLDIGRLNQGIKLELAWTEIKPYLAKIMGNLQILAQRKKLKLDWEVEPGLSANIDPNRYEEILTNLLTNAFKFSPTNGVVTVKAWGDQRNFLNISIADHGPGVPKDQVKRIFQKHEQLESEIKKMGFGLGLSIALQFALMHGGKISVASELGKGSVFTIQTPEAKIS